MGAEDLCASIPMFADAAEIEEPRQMVVRKEISSGE